MLQIKKIRMVNNNYKIVNKKLYIATLSRDTVIFIIYYNIK